MTVYSKDVLQSQQFKDLEAGLVRRKRDGMGTKTALSHLPLSPYYTTIHIHIKDHVYISYVRYNCA